MIRICIGLKAVFGNTFFIDNIEKVEVDCFKNYKIGIIDFFTEFRIWLSVDAKEYSDKFDNYFASHNQTAGLHSFEERCITIYSSQHTFFPYSISIISTEDDLICLKCMDGSLYKQAFRLVFFNNEQENPKTKIRYCGNLSVQGYNIRELDGLFSIEHESRTAFLNTFPHDYSYTFVLTKSEIKNSQGKFVNAQYFEDHPDQKEVFGAVYCLKMYDDDELFYKIGITRKKADYSLLTARQLHYEDTGYKIALEGWIPCPNFYEAWILEQQLLNKYKKHYPKRFFEGSTECLISVPEEFKNLK
jgi:hypothetical protein